MARMTSPASGRDHWRSPGVSVHSAIEDTSGSRTARSRLGMPPRADTLMRPRGVSRNSRASFDGETAETRFLNLGAASTLDITKRALLTEPKAPKITRLPAPRTADARACSSMTCPTPSRSAITAMPNPNPAASTAARTGRVASERHAIRSIMRSPPSRASSSAVVSNGPQGSGCA